MDTIRRARIERVIQAEVSEIARSVKDPRVPSSMTFTRVALTDDAQQATIYVTSFGLSDDEMKECVKGLQSASGYIRRHLSKALTVRTIPNLVFRWDIGLENSLRVHELLKQIQTETPQ